jgi:hypothetical protein
MKWAAVLITPAQIVLLRILFGFVPILILAIVRRSLERSHLRYTHHFFMMALNLPGFRALVWAQQFGVLCAPIQSVQECNCAAMAAVHQCQLCGKTIFGSCRTKRLTLMTNKRVSGKINLKTVQNGAPFHTLISLLSPLKSLLDS